MKIVDAPIRPTAAMQTRAATSTGESFATILASGRSVQSIRSERAFGFSETGILGAPRKAAGEKTAQSPKGNDTPRADRHEHIQAKSTSLGNNAKVAISARGGKAFARSTYSDAPANVPIPKKMLEQKVAPTDLTPGQRSQVQARSGSGIVAAPWVLQRSIRRKQKPALEVHGPEESLIIEIDNFDRELLNIEELSAAFSQVAREYYMTLRAISVDYNRFTLTADSLGEQDQCK